MGQLSGTNRLIFEGAKNGQLSRFLSRFGTMPGQVRDKPEWQFSAISDYRDNWLDKKRDNDRRPGQTGTKGFSLVPVVPVCLWADLGFENGGASA